MKYVACKLRNIFNILIGRDFYVRLDVIINHRKYGSSYGGWNIATNFINSESVIYSFGIGEDASFDISLIETYNLVVHGFDPTPRSIQWVRNQCFSKGFVMHEYGLADFDGEYEFFPPENPQHISHTILASHSKNCSSISVSLKRLSTIMKELEHDNLSVLKMDIEGAEYSVIDDIVVSPTVRPEQILVEFHHRFPGIGIKKTKDAISKIKSIGYRLYYVSRTKEEFCFIRNDILEKRS